MYYVIRFIFLSFDKNYPVFLNPLSIYHFRQLIRVEIILWFCC